jgi:hypothetical protein
MKWDVKIENKPNQKIVVKFDPMSEKLIFAGQYKPHNREWVNFTETEEQLWQYEEGQEKIFITFERIQELLLKTYEILKERVTAYEDIAEGMSAIKVIEIVEE